LSNEVGIRYRLPSPTSFRTWDLIPHSRELAWNLRDKSGVRVERMRRRFWGRQGLKLRAARPPLRLKVIIEEYGCRDRFKRCCLKFLKRKGALCLFYLALEHRLFCPHADANRCYPRDLPAFMQVWGKYGTDVMFSFLCLFFRSLDNYCCWKCYKESIVKYQLGRVKQINIT
jgi:hypothetical protein